MLREGETPHLQGPTAEQREALTETLSQVSQPVLEWACNQGVKLQVLQSGEELTATDALRDLTDRFERTLQPEKVSAIHQHLAPLTERIRTEESPDKANELRRQKRNQLAELLTLNACGAAVFTPAFAPLLAPGLSALLADPGETPSLKALALHHGADSAEEQQQFFGWMERLNGPRLQEARAATIAERSQLLESRPEALQRWLRQAEEQPETVPLDTTLHTLVVPDAHFFSGKPDQQPILIDRSDLRSIEGWQNGDFRGQWFFLDDKKHLLVRDSAVGLDTPIHELGHVVDMTLEKEHPEFYGALKPQIEKAHYQARLHGHAISNYAMANRREYIAEGFASYYTEPNRLKEKDPTLFDLVDQMVTFCTRQVAG